MYAVDTYDNESWRNDSLGREDRARAHQRFEDFVLADLVPAVHRDCGWLAPIAVTGPSLGAYKAVDLCLRRPDVFPVALGMSGVYDLDRVGWGERGDTFYFHNPVDYVAGMSGAHLDWIRSAARVMLAVGTGMWEDDSASGALNATLRFAACWPRRASRTSWTSGAATPRTTGPRGGGCWPSTFPAWSEREQEDAPGG